MFLRIVAPLQRIFVFTSSGSIAMSLLGAMLGLATGPRTLYLLQRESVTLKVFGIDYAGAAIQGVLEMALFAFASSAPAFMLAGCYLCLSRRPGHFTGMVLEKAVASAAIGTLIGLVLGSLNVFVWKGATIDVPLLRGLLFMGGVASYSRSFSRGAMLGFVLGTLYGVLSAARREIHQQRGDRE